MQPIVPESTRTGAIIIRAVRPTDLIAVSDCLAETFMREPMTRILGISRDEFTHFARLFVAKAACEGGSFLATEGENGPVMGCLITEDFITDPPEGIETISEKFMPIVELLGQMDEAYKREHLLAPGMLCHLFMGSVYASYAGRGVINALTGAVETYYREKGYIGAIAEATGPVSQHVYLNRLGYRSIASLPYADFTFEGQRVFAGLTECATCELIYKSF